MKAGGQAKTSSERAERAAVLLAVGVHALALMLARSSRESGRSAGGQSVLQDAPEFDLALEDDSTRAISHGSSPATATVDVAPRMAQGHRQTLENAPASPSVDTSQTGAGVALVPSAGVVDSATGTWTFSAIRQATPDLSLGVARYRAGPGSAAGAGDEAANHLFTTTNDHDLELGLGRGGPVRSAVEEAVQASESGILGVALFDVTLDRKGGVRVDLVEGKGDSTPWRRLRDPIERLVASKSVRLPEQALGIRVRVRVEALEKLVDGRETRTLGNSAGVTLGQAGTSSVAMKAMPSLFVEHRGKVCSGRLGVGPTGGDLAASTSFGADNPGKAPEMPSLLTPFTLGGGCSVENIGVPPRRLVAARVTSETLL